MRHPNGYGTVAKLSGNRRKPYIVKKTLGFDERGFPIPLIIGYAATREEGLMMLAEYNRNPYDIDLSKITLKEIFDRWSKREFPKMNANGSTSLSTSMKSAFKKLAPLEGMKYKEIKAYHMQETIDHAGGYSTQGAVKNLWGHLDKFALELDVITKANSALTSAAPIPETKKRPFTDQEVDQVWAVKDNDWVDSVLVFLYSGWRISELLALKAESVDLDAKTMTGGTKSRAGKGRIVPIHSKIFELVKRRVEQGNDYLFAWNGKRCSATQYYTVWNEIMESLKMDHTPHECRHTFRSRLDSAGANKVCIDLMMGHKSKGTGERIYTHKGIEELRLNIELITR